MANVPVVNQGKTKFVKEFLAEHGDAKRAAINEAWQAAGHEDEISESLVYKMRSQHGSTTRQADADEATQEADRPTSEVENTTSKNKVENGSAGKKPVEQAEDQSNDKAPGKAAFVEEILRRDPKANSRAVNQAWSEAGHEGTISDPTFYKVRGRLTAAPEPGRSVSSKTDSSEVTAAAGEQRKARRTSTVTATSKSSDPERGCGRGGSGHRRPDVQTERQRRHARGRGGAASGPKAVVPQPGRMREVASDSTI